MGRVGKNRTGIQVRDQLRLRDVGDIENVEAVVPIAHIEPVAVAQGMMAARRSPIGPRIFLAAGFPLTGDPPTTNLDGLCRIDEVEDHDDVTDVAFRGRRDVGVAAVEIEPAYAATDGSAFRD